MNPILRYGLVTFAGVFCALLAWGFGRSIRGRFATQAFLHWLVDGLAVIPGIALTLSLFPPDADHSRIPTTVRLVWLFILVYAGSRVLAERLTASRRNRREMTLPFEHWFALVGTDKESAIRFLQGYLTQRGANALTELRLACVTLERTHVADSHVGVALDWLRAEIARREHGVTSDRGI